MTSPLVAIEFLTRIHLRRNATASMDDVARSQAWFAAVGLLIGAAAAGADWLASRALSDVAAAAIGVVVLAAVTGALHLDGLGDTADGLLGGATPERRLAIMRDVHAGSFAIVAIVSVLMLKFGALSSLAGDERRMALVLAPAASRCAMVVVAAAFPYARASGMGDAFRRHAWPVAVLASSAVAFAAGGLLFGVAGAGIVVAAVVAAIAVGLYARRLIGGVTGDVYGAAIEISEACALLCVAAFAGRGWL